MTDRFESYAAFPHMMELGFDPSSASNFSHRSTRRFIQSDAPMIWAAQTSGAAAKSPSTTAHLAKAVTRAAVIRRVSLCASKILPNGSNRAIWGVLMCRSPPSGGSAIGKALQNVQTLISEIARLLRQIPDHAVEEQLAIITIIAPGQQLDPLRRVKSAASLFLMCDAD